MPEPSSRSRSDIQRDLGAALDHLRALETQGLGSDDPKLLAAEDSVSNLRRELRSSTTRPAPATEQRESSAVDAIQRGTAGQSGYEADHRPSEPSPAEAADQGFSVDVGGDPTRGLGGSSAPGSQATDVVAPLAIDEPVLVQVTRAIEGQRLNAASKYLEDDSLEARPEIDSADRTRLHDLIDAQRVRLQRTLHREVDSIASLPEARRVLDQLPRARLALPGEEVDRLRDRVATLQQDLRVTDAMTRLRSRYQLDSDVRNDSDPQDGDSGAEVRDDLAQLKLPVSTSALQAEVAALLSEIDVERLRRLNEASKVNTIALTNQYIGLLQRAKDKKASAVNATQAIVADILEVSRVVPDQGSAVEDDALWTTRIVARSRPIDEVIGRYLELARGQATQGARNRLSSARALLGQGEIEESDHVLVNLLGTPEWSYVDEAIRNEIEQFRSTTVPEIRSRRLHAEKLFATITASTTIEAVEEALSRVLELDRSAPGLGKTVFEAIDRLVDQASVNLALSRQALESPQDRSQSANFGDVAGRFEKVAGLIPGRSNTAAGSSPEGSGDWRGEAVRLVTNFRSLVNDFDRDAEGRLNRDRDGRQARIDLEEWLKTPIGQRSQPEGRRLISRVRESRLPGMTVLIDEAQAELDEIGLKAELEDVLAGRDAVRARDLLNALEQRSGGPNPETRGIRARIVRLEMFMKVRQDLLGVQALTVDLVEIARELDDLIRGQRSDDVFSGVAIDELRTLHAKRRAQQLQVIDATEGARRQLSYGDEADYSQALHLVDDAIEGGASSQDVMELRREILDKWWASLTLKLDTGITTNDIDSIMGAFDQIESNFPGKPVDLGRRTKAFKLIAQGCTLIGTSEQSARQLTRYLDYATRLSAPQVQSELEELRRFVSRIVEFPRVRQQLAHRRTIEARGTLDRLAEEGFQEPELAEFWSEVYEQSRQWVEAIRLAELIPDQAKREFARLRITSVRDSEERLRPINERLNNLKIAINMNPGPREASDLFQQLSAVRTSASAFPAETARLEAECAQVLERFMRRQEEEILRSGDHPIETRAVPYLKLLAAGVLSDFRAVEFRRMLAPLQAQALKLIGDARTIHDDVTVSQVTAKDLAERINTCLDQLEQCEDPGDPRAVRPRLTRARNDVVRLIEQLQTFEDLNSRIAQRLLGVRSRADLQNLQSTLDGIDPRFKGPPAHPSFHRLKRVYEELIAEIREDEEIALRIEQRWRLGEFEQCETVARQAVARAALSTFSDGSRFGKLESIEVDDGTRTYRGVKQIHEIAGQKRGFVATWCVLIKNLYELFEIQVPPNILHVQTRRVRDTVQALVDSAGKKFHQRRDNLDEDDLLVREFLLRFLHKLERGASTSFPEDLDGSRSSASARAFETGASEIRQVCADSRDNLKNNLDILDKEISDIIDNIRLAKDRVKAWQDSRIAILRPKGHKDLYDEAHASVVRLEGLRPKNLEAIRLRKMLMD